MSTVRPVAAVTAALSLPSVDESVVGGAAGRFRKSAQSSAATTSTKTTTETTYIASQS
jgi:hypothetical protein